VTADYAKDLWMRALNALRSAETLVDVSPDDAASRAYYAVFDAVSAAFALQGRSFTKHREVRSSVHRDFVKTGQWSIDQGADFDALWELRDTGDYGGDLHVSHDEAKQAVAMARKIVDAVRADNPQLLPAAIAVGASGAGPGNRK